MADIAIESQSMGKYYRIYAGNMEKWLDLLLPGNHGTNFWALRKLSFRINAGEAVGLIGLNGSGKSTLSNLIAGVSRPSIGTLRVKGRVSIIAVNAGLNSQLTGLENIEMKGLLIGLTRRQIRALTPRIIEYSGIERFIRQPVRTYSSGMRSRLAFAISINVNPDILVIDEGLSVGDNTFVDRCLESIQDFKRNGKTMVMTSHSGGQIQCFCDRLIWMECGEIRMDGTPEEVLAAYEEFQKWYKRLSAPERAQYAEQTYAARCQNSRGERLLRGGDNGGKRLHNGR